MTDMNVYTFSSEQLTRISNQVKELTIALLHNEGHLEPNADLAEIAASYTIVLAERGVLGKLWDRLRGNETDGLRFNVLKTVEPREEWNPKRGANVTHLRPVENEGESED